MALSKNDSISRNWLKEMKELFKDGENRATEKKYRDDGACIYTVPESLRNERPGAYVPRVVSLGPFHTFKSEFSRAENYKNELVFRIIKNANGPLVFSELAQRLSSQFGERIKKSYEQCEYSSEVLGWLMAKDALFLLDFLQSNFESNTSENVHSTHKVYDPKGKGPLLFAIQSDILKMENQIPMFVLKEVLKWEQSSEEFPFQSLREILEVSCREFSPFIKITGGDFHVYDGSEKHLLEYLYKTIVPPFLRGKVDDHVPVDMDNSVSSSYAINPHPRHENNDGEGLVASICKRLAFCCCSSNIKTSVDLPSATELHRRGVKFAALKTGNMKEIRFDMKAHTFYLPAMRMDDRTEVVLRNLVAHEAMVELQTRALLSYVDLMDRLIDTASDVAVLKRCGVFRSHMGSDKEVANAWNGMGRSMWKSGYEPVDRAVEDVLAYYRSKFTVIFAEFMQVHFSKPWRAASVFGACLFLLLTLVQTYLQFEQVRLQTKADPHLH